MIYDSKSENNILTKILEQSYDSASFLFDISKGANVILKESGQIFIANSIFFKMFELEFNVFQKDLFLKDLFEDNENETLEKFLKNRISDPYNSPKTSIFQTILESGKSMIVILTAIRIPGTNNILVSATEPKKPLEDILEAPENNAYKSGFKKTFSKYLDDEDESRDYAFEKEDSKNYPVKRNDLRNYQLEILNEILISANSSFTLNRMLDNVLNIISTHLGFEINYIYLKNSDGKTANIISAFGAPHFFIESQKNLDVRSWPYNLIFYAGQAKYIENLPDVTISRHDLNILENLGALSYAAIPLISDNTVIGALYTAKAYEGTFTSFEKETLEIIGKEISNIILRGMLQDKLEKECIEARQCFGLILDDINDLNENLMRSVESIKDPKKSLNELAKLMSKDIHENRLIINNLKIIREIGDSSNIQLKKVILDESIRKIIPRYPTIKIKYTDSLYCVYSDEYLPEVFANLINFMLDLGTDSSDIIIEAEAVSDSVILSVESTGPGLSDEEKLLLFSDFDEENIHLDAKSLGLYTAFILLKHYNGRITVADRVAGNRGKGLSFKIGLIRYYDES